MVGGRERETRLSSLRELAAVVRPYRRTFGIGLLLGLVGAASALAQPLVAGRVISALAGDASVVGPVVTLLGLLALGALTSGMSAWLLDRGGETLVRDTRRSLASRLLRVRLSVLDRASSGDLVARLTSDATLLRAAATGGIDAAVVGVATLLVALVLMAIVDLPLFLTSLAVMFSVLATIGFVVPRMGRASNAAQDAVGDIGTALGRALGAIRTVKASAAEVREEARAHAAIDRAAAAGNRLAVLAALAAVVGGVAIQATFLAVLGVGGVRVTDGAMTVADLVTFLLYLLYLAGPVGSIVAAVSQVQSARAALTRVREVETMAIEDPDFAPVEATTHDGGALVVFEDVAFRYRESDGDVLTAVSFDVPRRGHVALVGPSGAGKSTIFGLIERFYEPTGGRITFDGVPIRELPRDWLRARIGYVEQDAPVLGGTLRENLTYARPDVPDDVLAAAIQDARLDELVGRLPEGLDTEVGERGVTLSGGERQRVAIARALVREPTLLLLDEATAQLDAINELLLRDVIGRAAERRAVVTIAHRLSAVVAADRILVIVDGRVRATGTHDELVRSDGLYAELAATQFVAPGT